MNIKPTTARFTRNNRFVISCFFLSAGLLLFITASFAQALDVSSCPLVEKRNNGNGQASRSAGTFSINSTQTNPVAANVVGTSYQNVPFDPTTKTGSVIFKWSSATTIANLPIITRVWLTANGATNGLLSAIKFGPPPPPVIVGQNYYVDYSFYVQNMPPAGKVTLEFADPQTNRPSFRCTFDLRSNGTTTEPTIVCSPTIITQPSNLSICGTTSATFTVVGDGISSVQWQSSIDNITFNNVSNAGDFGGATSTTLTISNPANYDGKYYRAVLTGNTGCSTTTSNGALLVAKPKPTAVFVGSTSLCGTGTRSMGVNLTGSGPWSVTYTTTPSGGSTTPTTVSNITSSPFYFSVNPSGSTTYAITAVSDKFCTNSSLTGSVSATITAAPTVTPTNATTCFGNSSFNLIYSATGSPNQYTLTAGVRAMAGFSTITNATLSASPASITIPSNVAAGVYDFNLVVTNSSTGCSSASVPITVTVRALPAINATAGNGTVCIGATTTLTASPSGLSSYSWTISPSATVIATGITTTINVSANTTYTVAGVDAFGCSAIATVNVTTVAGPSISITPTSATICSGNGTVLTASGGNTFSWSPSTGLSATTGASVVATPSSTTTYTVTSQNITGCQSTSTVTVTVNTPNIGVTSNATICSGTSRVLTATGGSTYSWYPSTVLSASSGASVTATPTATTTYYVQGTDVNGCTGTTSSTVTISATPVDAATSTANTLIFCTQGTTTFPLTINTTSGVTSMTWAYSTNGTSYTDVSSPTAITGVTLTPSSSGSTNAVLTLSGYGNSGYTGARYFRLVIVGPSCTYNYDIFITDSKATATIPSHRRCTC